MQASLHSSKPFLGYGACIYKKKKRQTVKKQVTMSTCLLNLQSFLKVIQIALCFAMLLSTYKAYCYSGSHFEPVPFLTKKCYRTSCVMMTNLQLSRAHSNEQNPPHKTYCGSESLIRYCACIDILEALVKRNIDSSLFKQPREPATLLYSDVCLGNQSTLTLSHLL